MLEWCGVAKEFLWRLSYVPRSSGRWHRSGSSEEARPCVGVPTARVAVPGVELGGGRSMGAGRCCHVAATLRCVHVAHRVPTTARRPTVTHPNPLSFSLTLSRARAACSSVFRPLAHGYPTGRGDAACHAAKTAPRGCSMVCASPFEIPIHCLSLTAAVLRSAALGCPLPRRDVASSLWHRSWAAGRAVGGQPGAQRQGDIVTALNLDNHNNDQP